MIDNFQIDTTQIATNVDLQSILSDAGISSASTGISELDSIVASIDSDLAGKILNTAAHELGLHDFYSTHIMTWCEGTLTGDDSNSDNANTTNSDELVTRCTKPAFPFSFDPVEILQDELLQGLTLEDLGFPTEDVNKVVDALETAYRAMSICFLIGVILAGVSILTGLTAFYASRILEVLNQLVAILAFLMLGVGSAIGTAIAVLVKNVINEKAKPINVFAVHSNKFLGMTWASVACMLLVTMLWCCLCCCGRHQRKQKADPMMEKGKA